MLIKALGNNSHVLEEERFLCFVSWRWFREYPFWSAFHTTSADILAHRATTCTVQLHCDIAKEIKKSKKEGIFRGIARLHYHENCISW